MSKKSFFIGFLVGAVTMFVAVWLIGTAMNKKAGNSPVDFLEVPVSYENKTEAKFQVIQVLGSDAALANEASDGGRMYLGNTVLLLGSDFYDDQVVTVHNPQRVGSYSYNTRNDIPKTVPVIEVK